jgi:hypothetical protein
MSELPDALRREVIAEVYRQADHLDWEGLSQSERTTWYDRWVDVPSIGGVLTRFIPRERARRWLKDVPMKHYARARSGVGPYASLVTRRLPGPAEIAVQVFGPAWDVIDGTVLDKPNRCLITDQQNERLMIWGSTNNLRALVWAGLNAAIDSKPHPVIVITTPQGQPLGDGERRRHLALGARIGVDMRHTTVRQTIQPAAAPTGSDNA